MRILFVVSEAAPFVKTGGLADVAGALSSTLARRGHDVRLVLPKYRSVDGDKYRLLPLMPELNVTFGGETVRGQVLRTNYPGSQMPVYFLDAPQLYDREGIYTGEKGDFPDNNKRFSFLNLAALWMCKGLDWQPEVIHCHDWQTGLIPALLREHPEIKADPFFEKIRTVFTIHNLAYQGNFAPQLVSDLNLPWSVFTADGIEFYGRASMLKSGLMFSDAITTVSKTYAEEVKTPTFGGGLEGVLRARANRFFGIVNGIDTRVWDPQEDPHIAAKISPASGNGKAGCKADLQRFFGLPEKKVPILGMVTRLTGQKGLDILVESLGTVLQDNVQFVILGSGDPRYEKFFSDAGARFSKKIGARMTYDEKIAHKIIAGSDILLVPSAFEPCGLTQMYAMRYGTVPVVRRTGGLADTVTDASAQGIQNGVSTGFVFTDYNADALTWAIKRAIELYNEDKGLWNKLRRNGMAKDFSWEAASGLYEELYRRVLALES